MMIAMTVCLHSTALYSGIALSYSAQKPEAHCGWTKGDSVSLASCWSQDLEPSEAGPPGKLCAVAEEPRQQAAYLTTAS